MARLHEIVFDCARPARAARFWAALLEGYAVRPYDAAEVARLAGLGRTPETDPVVLVDGPGPVLCFHEAPGAPREGRSPIHLDLRVADRGAERARALSLGARLVREAEGYTVMADPEGHRFCLVGAERGEPAPAGGVTPP